MILGEFYKIAQGHDYCVVELGSDPGSSTSKAALSILWL